MDYLIVITQDGKVIGREIVHNPAKEDEGWLAETINKIMTPVRQTAKGPIGDYHIKVTEFQP